MKKKLISASIDLNGGQNLPRELRVSQDVGFIILSKFSSLIDRSTGQISTSGNLVIQETFSSISKFAGSVSVWLFSRPNFKLLHKASIDVFSSDSSRSCPNIKYIMSLRQNLAGLHFIFSTDREQVITSYLTKLASSTIKFLTKEVQLPNSLPILSIAATLVHSFDNPYSKALASSIAFANGEMSAHTEQPFREHCHHGCATLASHDISWKGDAVEPQTGIKFPAYFEDSFSKTRKVLVGIGSKSIRILRLKTLRLYAFGLYVHTDSICEKLGSKYASVPVEELKNRLDFFEDFLSAFEKSLRTRLYKMNPDTDYQCLRVFRSSFTQDIAFRVGTTIDFRQTSDGQLITEVGGRHIGSIQSKELCRAFFDMYIGDPPISEHAKEEIAENVAGLIRRC